MTHEVWEGSGAGIGVPHSPQKRLPSGLGWPQCEQKPPPERLDLTLAISSSSSASVLLTVRSVPDRISASSALIVSQLLRGADADVVITASETSCG